MPTIIPIDKGEIITARRLNDYGSNINDLNQKVFSKPSEIEPAPPPKVQSEAEEEEIVGANVYIETSRVTDEVQVFDQNDENYALISRIQEVTLTNNLGDSFVFKFNNPEV